MKPLKKNLSEWEDKGLISAELHQQITDYEQNKSKIHKSKFVLYGLSILGVCVLCIGIISLVAANWKNIHTSIKLGGGLMILSATAGAVYRQHKKGGKILFDAMILFFSLLCLASIALVSQIFHTGGEIYQALAFWLVITFPLSTFSRNNFFPHLWTAGLIAEYFLWAFSGSSWWHSVDSYFGNDIVLAATITVPYLTFLLSMMLNWSGHLARHSKILGMWAVLTGFIAVGATDFYYSHGHSDLFPKLLLPPYILMILSLAVLNIRPIYTKKERSIIISMIIITMILHMPNFIVILINIYQGGIFLGALYSIVLFFLFGMLFTLRNQKRLFNMMLVLIGLRFLIIYFQVFGSLAMTAIGLILSGILIIAAAALWFKKREAILHWFGEISK